MLAPVAAEIDGNLQALRAKSPMEIGEALAIAFNANLANTSRSERAAYVLEEALRFVDLHDWKAEITDDSTRLSLTGGSVSIDLGLSATIFHYIEHGP